MISILEPPTQSPETSVESATANTVSITAPQECSLEPPLSARGLEILDVLNGVFDALETTPLPATDSELWN